MISPEAAWKATLGELELQMTKATFNSWLKDARLVNGDQNEYVIALRTESARDWVENRLRDTILRTLSSVVGRRVQLRFVLGSGDAPAARNGNPANHRGHEAESNGRAVAAEQSNGNYSNGGHLISGNFNGRYTFSTFVAGSSNRLAHAAALSVAERPGQTYNPLFIYGGVGLGKTHLLHAIGQRCLENGLVVCYVSSETFTNDLIQYIRQGAQKMAQFREKYRTPDVLLIDDVQFIAGKDSTQEELFHTFNDLHSRGRQVVLSSDRPPKAMVTLEERLQSRFEWGLMADIQLPDIEMRMAILQAKAETMGLYIPDSVLDMIAHHVRNNIRELEGALNKVVAYAQSTGSAIDTQLATMALADLVHRPEKVTVEQVIETVAAHYHITPDALHSNSRSRAVAFPRQMAMYLARTETDASFPQIGTLLGNRDHTTILYGYEKIAALLETDGAVRRDLLTIKAVLYNSTPA